VILDDILSEAPIHQFYMQLALEKVQEQMSDQIREQIIQDIRNEQRLIDARQALLTVFQARFPKLSKIAQKKLAQIEDLALLRTLLVKVASSQTVEDAQYLLLELDYPDELAGQHQ